MGMNREQSDDASVLSIDHWYRRIKGEEYDGQLRS